MTASERAPGQDIQHFTQIFRQRFFPPVAEVAITVGNATGKPTFQQEFQPVARYMYLFSSWVKQWEAAHPHEALLFDACGQADLFDSPALRSPEMNEAILHRERFLATQMRDFYEFHGVTPPQELIVYLAGPTPEPATNSI